MAIYFRLTSDGRILMAKTLGNKGITEQEFMEKAKEVDFATLLKFCPKEQIDQYGITRENTASYLQTEMEIYKLYKPNLSRIGPVVSYNPGEGFYCTGCFVGDKFFKNVHGSKELMKEAIEYGIKFYGEDFMKQIMEQGLLDEPSRRDMMSKLNKDIPTPYAYVHYFSNKQEISKEGYDSLVAQEENYTRIRSTTCPLHDDNNVTMVTPKKFKR